jgi:AcrR family transcriptional regulator
VDTNAAPAGSIAERKRQLVRDELAEAAVRLLADQGFEQTTVDQIAAAVGLSRRTFSRYFESKEDVLVHMLAGAGTQLCTELRARPATEPPPLALRRALAPLTAFTAGHPEALSVIRLILDTPPLHARLLERESHWQDDMTAILAQRAGLDPRTDLRPALAVGVALTAFRTALRHWADTNGTTDMNTLLDQAFTVITPALNLTTATR